MVLGDASVIASASDCIRKTGIRAAPQQLGSLLQDALPAPQSGIMQYPQYRVHASMAKPTICNQIAPETCKMPRR